MVHNGCAAIATPRVTPRPSHAIADLMKRLTNQSTSVFVFDFQVPFHAECSVSFPTRSSSAGVEIFAGHGSNSWTEQQRSWRTGILHSCIGGGCVLTVITFSRR